MTTMSGTVSRATISTTVPKSPTPEKQISNSLGMTFAYIPPGEFMMGSPKNEPERSSDERQHKVRITKGFHMQTTEVTQGQWKAVMGENPSSFEKCGENCPVENVSWGDAQDFIRKARTNTACQLRRNGSMRAGRGQQRRFILTNAFPRIRRTMTVIIRWKGVRKGKIVERRFLWRAK